MTLFGLSPAMFAVGAVALCGAVLLLHLLRVRLRRVEVDTLLFFQLAGSLRQPRVLPGKPARWLSLLLALLAVLAAWSAFADPHGDAAAASRIVVIEPASGAVRQARLDAARELVERGGLGPRGAVLAAAPSPAVLLAAGDPTDALTLRSAALPLYGSKADGAAALRAASDLLRPGDEVVWIGGAMPAIGGAVPVLARPSGGDAAVLLRGLQWLETADGALLQLDVTAAAGGRAVLQSSGVEVGSAAFAAQPQQLRLGPVTAAALGGELRLRLDAGGASHELTLPPPSTTSLAVHIGDDVPAELAQAIALLLEVDPGLRAASAAAADVLVQAHDGDEARPCLLLDAGSGGGARAAELMSDSPVALSLRDRVRRDAPALAAVADATVWVEDRAQGAPLVQAERRGERYRVRIVDWLLQPATHADVPVLLGAALHQLGARPRQRLAIAGMPLMLPAMFADATAGSGDVRLLPADGSYRLQWGTPGLQQLHTPTGVVDVQVLAAAAAGPGVAAAAPQASARGGDGSLLPWLAALLFLLVTLDAILFHRGRLP